MVNATADSMAADAHNLLGYDMEEIIESSIDEEREVTLIIIDLFTDRHLTILQLLWPPSKSMHVGSKSGVSLCLPEAFEEEPSYDKADFEAKYEAGLLTNILQDFQDIFNGPQTPEFDTQWLDEQAAKEEVRRAKALKRYLVEKLVRHLHFRL